MRKPIDNARILAIKAKQGDSGAFTLLFDNYSKKIYRFVYYKVSNKETAEDLTSQCFLKVWEQISAGAKIKHFQAFIYQIARNLVIDYYRSRQREELPLIYQVDSGETDKLQFKPDENLDIKQLESLLLNIKGDVREIVLLRFVEELSIKEIAKITGKSSGNIRVIIHRAVKELNKYFI